MSSYQELLDLIPPLEMPPLSPPSLDYRDNLRNLLYYNFPELEDNDLPDLEEDYDENMTFEEDDYETMPIEELEEYADTLKIPYDAPLKESDREHIIDNILFIKQFTEENMPIEILEEYAYALQIPYDPPLKESDRERIIGDILWIEKYADEITEDTIREGREEKKL